MAELTWVADYIPRWYARPKGLAVCSVILRSNWCKLFVQPDALPVPIQESHSLKLVPLTDKVCDAFFLISMHRSDFVSTDECALCSRICYAVLCILFCE